jgi:hypothetical protein
VTAILDSAADRETHLNLWGRRFLQSKDLGIMGCDTLSFSEMFPDVMKDGSFFILKGHAILEPFA